MRMAIGCLPAAKNLRRLASAFSLVISVSALPAAAWAQNAPPTASLWWRPAAIAHARQMHLFQEPFSGTQLTPEVIPRLEIEPDASGLIATDQPAGPTSTASNAFFRNLGTNQRTCFTCHQPQTGWTVSAASVQQRFLSSAGNDPIFRLIDGATCPSDEVSTIAEKLKGFGLVLGRGLFRIGLPLPATLTMTGLKDPYHCSNNSVVNVTSPSGTTPIYSFYRRPVPTTNFFFQTSNTPNLFMWDGREASLTQQSIDATLIHAQGSAPPTLKEQSEIVGFESGLFTAQNYSLQTRSLEALGATGGPAALSLKPFVLGAAQPSAASLPQVFDIFLAWADLTGKDPVSEARTSVARGEAIFNSTTKKSCSGCHNTVDNGNRDNSVNAGVTKFFNTGLANASAATPPAGADLTAAALAELEISGLPVFTVTCNDGSILQGDVFTVTDLGRAMITGACADIGAFKAPSLRGLASRAPYFHNGSAASLTDVANFYNDNFSIGLTSPQIRDLVNFLKTL